MRNEQEQDQHHEHDPGGIDAEMLAIYRRLQGAKHLRQQLFPEISGISPLEERIGELHRDADVSSLARSEELIPPNEIPILNQKVNQVRQAVITHGDPFTNNTDYDEWVREGLRSEEDARNLFFDDRDNPNSGERFEVIADRFLPESDQSGTGYRLAMVRFRVGNTIDLEFGFANDYRLSVEFNTRDESGTRVPPYTSSDTVPSLTLDKMTKEEYTIITDSLNQYLQLCNQNENDEQIHPPS